MEKIGLEQSGKGLFRFHGFSLISFETGRRRQTGDLPVYMLQWETLSSSCHLNQMFCWMQIFFFLDGDFTLLSINVTNTV